MSLKSIPQNVTLMSIQLQAIFDSIFNLCFMDVIGHYIRMY